MSRDIGDTCGQPVARDLGHRPGSRCVLRQYAISTVAGNVASGNGLSAEGFDPGAALQAAVNGAVVGAVTGATFGVGTALIGAPVAWNSAGSFAIASVAGPLGSAAGILFKGLTGQKVGPGDALGALASMIPLPDSQKVAIPVGLVLDQLVSIVGNVISPPDTSTCG